MIVREHFTRSWLPGRWRSRPRILALFSFRYDAHLVPDLIENLRPLVDGYVAWDDRAATDTFSSEPRRRRKLIRAARNMRARWVMFIDPDERIESAAVDVLPDMTRDDKPMVIGFHFRELYTPDSYRVDGLWGKKVRYNLFPLLDGQKFRKEALHAPAYPIGYRRRMTDLNLYHLKMIAPQRRAARRDLYKLLDPEKAYQDIGYDYLADDAGAEFATIPPERGYLPAHRDDNGLWMGDIPATPATEPQPTRDRAR